jgi:hypothetical protein
MEKLQLLTGRSLSVVWLQQFASAAVLYPI